MSPILVTPVIAEPLNAPTPILVKFGQFMVCDKLLQFLNEYCPIEVTVDKFILVSVRTASKASFAISMAPNLFNSLNVVI